MYTLEDLDEIRTIINTMKKEATTLAELFGYEGNKATVDTETYCTVATIDVIITENSGMANWVRQHGVLDKASVAYGYELYSIPYFYGLDDVANISISLK